MANKVEIISSEMVKPFSPTPENLRIYKLSLMDQMGASVPYTSMIIFYATPLPDDFATRLKESLQLVLNHDCMYPLAGRVKDMYSIDCSDQGAYFIQAKVDEDFSKVVKNPKIDLYSLLFPPPPQEVWTNPFERALLAVQVSEFSRGGIAISISAWHGIMDGSALAFLLKTWADIALASNKGKSYSLGDGFVMDCTTIYRPSDIAHVVKDPLKIKDLVGDKTRGNIFTFRSNNIASIKEKTSKIGERQATTFEAVSAFLWAAIIVARKKSRRSIHTHIYCSAINLRTRIIPSLPLQCLGNHSHVAQAICHATEEGVDLGVLVEKIRESTSKVTNEEILRQYGGDTSGKSLVQPTERCLIVDDAIGLVVTSSFRGFPFYEADFGWGKPSWVGFDEVMNDSIRLLDSVNGNGIEVWMRLREEDMVKLEQDVEFLSYVSSIKHF